MSVLASGRITLPEARQYVDTTPGLSGVVIGVSREEQARQTFRFFSGRGEA